MAGVICWNGGRKSYRLLSIECKNCKCDEKNFHQLCYFQRQNCKGRALEKDYSVNVTFTRKNYSANRKSRKCCEGEVYVRYIQTPSKRSTKGHHIFYNERNASEMRPSITTFRGIAMSDVPGPKYAQPGQSGYMYEFGVILSLALLIFASSLFLWKRKVNKRNKSTNSSVNQVDIAATFSPTENQESEYSTIDEAKNGTGNSVPTAFKKAQGIHLSAALTRNKDSVTCKQYELQDLAIEDMNLDDQGSEYYSIDEVDNATQNENSITINQKSHLLREPVASLCSDPIALFQDKDCDSFEQPDDESVPRDIKEVKTMKNINETDGNIDGHYFSLDKGIVRYPIHMHVLTADSNTRGNYNTVVNMSTEGSAYNTLTFYQKEHDDDSDYSHIGENIDIYNHLYRCRQIIKLENCYYNSDENEKKN